MPSEIFRPGLLDGQVIVVTGGGSGLGRATALELTALGATVVVAGRRMEPLEQTVSHSAVLERGVLMVSHAGHGSVMKALWHGRPMVLVPWGRDQARSRS